MALNIEKDIQLDGTGLTFAGANTIRLGSTRTEDGGETVNIIQSDTPRIILNGGCEIPALKISGLEVRNNSGDEICGTASFSVFGVNNVTTTQAKTGSIIILTPHTTTPDGELYVASINGGVSFTFGYTGTTDPQEFYWLIINPV